MTARPWSNISHSRGHHINPAARRDPGPRPLGKSSVSRGQQHHVTSLLHITSRPPYGKFAVAGRFLCSGPSVCEGIRFYVGRDTSSTPSDPLPPSRVVVREYSHTPVATTTASRRARPSTLIRSWHRRG
ncbi:hypothetical protein BGW80DRAFT_1347132 [Lactifluus volemus]|nr:hypothetical protein BGW80DRAFT_1347132 [Lactifluus volemus]